LIGHFVVIVWKRKMTGCLQTFGGPCKVLYKFKNRFYTRIYKRQLLVSRTVWCVCAVYTQTPDTFISTAHSEVCRWAFIMAHFNGKEVIISRGMYVVMSASRLTRVYITLNINWREILCWRQSIQGNCLWPHNKLPCNGITTLFCIHYSLMR